MNINNKQHWSALIGNVGIWVVVGILIAHAFSYPFSSLLGIATMIYISRAIGRSY